MIVPGPPPAGAVAAPAPNNETTKPAPIQQAKTTAEFEQSMTTVGEVLHSQTVKMLVYGAAGAGKTRLCGTAPAPFIISAEAGLLTFRKMVKDGLLDPNAPVKEVSTIQDVRDALNWCRSGAAKQRGVLTVCLDSISEIVEKCLAAHKVKSKDPRMAYGDMAVDAIELVKDFRDLSDFNVLITAKQVIGKDPITGVEKASPTAPGQQVGPALPYLFDEVFHAYTDKTAQGDLFHALRTHAAFNADAKDRSGVLDEIEYPDANHIINKILTS